jgi:hypothetical protein
MSLHDLERFNAIVAEYMEKQTGVHRLTALAWCFAIQALRCDAHGYSNDAANFRALAMMELRIAREWR